MCGYAPIILGLAAYTMSTSELSVNLRELGQGAGVPPLRCLLLARIGGLLVSPDGPTITNVTNW